MHDSPRLRRLRNDLAAMERLRSESTVFDFQAQGNPPNHYRIVFRGRGLQRDAGKVRPAVVHQVEIKLGSSYPRSIPEIRWLSPIHHPNISEIGMVCLGGYGTHWVPSVQLDELCTMLWDMARYHNFDVRSPYNRDAALWAGHQTTIPFPTDPRPLRDVREAQGRLDPNAEPATPSTTVKAASRPSPRESTVARVRRLFDWRGRPTEEGLTNVVTNAPAQTSSLASSPPQDDGVLILETHVDAAVTGDAGDTPPPPRVEDDILFIE